MNNLLHAIGLSSVILIAGTLLYAATNENKITEIRKQQELHNFLQNHREAVIFFYNPNCPVCIAFKKKQIFPETANRLPHIGFAQISSEEGTALHREYKITVFPTFIFFKDGKVIHKRPGYVENPTFTNEIKKIFEKYTK